ncbi:MAG: TIGR02677 family protein [Xanthobacteraceae bacterium]|nr:TIGR02677 family protein [Xanthobacteraceae bacterium]
MSGQFEIATHQDLFRHVTADNAVLYRCVLDVCAAAERQLLLYVRPSEILTQAQWPGEPPTAAELDVILDKLTEWRNLDCQADNSRVTSLGGFYRRRSLYRLSKGGVSVEMALSAFAREMQRRGELQTVALEDIGKGLGTLIQLARSNDPDVAKIYETLNSLMTVFNNMAETARAFMAGLLRGVDLQDGDVDAVLNYKQRLIDYIRQFVGDLVSRTGAISQDIDALQLSTDTMFKSVARRQARNAPPGEEEQAYEAELTALHDRWRGLRMWFIGGANGERSQSEQLRARARDAIPQMLRAIAAINERRSGRSDRSADFKVLAHWFLDCETEDDAHRLSRAAFGLNPARHYSENTADGEVVGVVSWEDAPSIVVPLRLRETGYSMPRGRMPRVHDRSASREKLKARVGEEHAQIEAARLKFATGQSMLLSELWLLNRHEFRFLLTILGEAIAANKSSDGSFEIQSTDGMHLIRLEPFEPDTEAAIETEEGTLRGRDHRITITQTGPT